jgi:hypothetical protein
MDKNAASESISLQVLSRSKNSVWSFLFQAMQLGQELKTFIICLTKKETFIDSKIEQKRGRSGFLRGFLANLCFLRKP